MSRPAIQQFAGHYIQNMGFAVVPLDPRKKECSILGWPTRTFGPDDFCADQNIGIRSEHGLAVVDDDCKPHTALGLACVEHFLPPTPAAYGRGEFRRRKRLYRCPELTAPITFTDIDGTHLLQLRVGLQDMAPPSIHPDTGETLQWDGLLLPPTTVTREALVASVRSAYAALLIGRYWPTGGRHDLRLAYARVLLETLGLSATTATDVLEWACRLGGSDADGVADVRPAVESTQARLAANQPAVGASTVAEHLAANDVGRLLLRRLRHAFGVESLILNPNDPLPTARTFVHRHHTTDGVRTLHHQHSVFFAYEASVGAYGEYDDATVRASLYRFLEKAHRPGDDDAEPPLFQPTRSKVENVLDALRAVCNLPTTQSPPCWLKQPNVALDPRDMLAFRNGLLHIPTRTLYPGTPYFFTLNGLDFSYDPSAPAPTQWLSFLAGVWSTDPEAISTLQEIFGYLLTPDTRQQKVFMLVGPPRSGKGVTGRVLRCLLGDRNVCSPTLAAFGRDFGKQVLVGKTLALISDARISGRTDTAVVAETLLSISGEDAQTVERKFLPDWNGKLAVRFVLLTNELPRLGDVSGALAKRFVVLPLTESFYGKEDLGLFDRLVGELPGILNWALAGRDRLAERGHFVQPKSASELIQDLEDLASPEATFLRECTDRQDGGRVSQKNLFGAWRQWCARNGRDHVGTVQTFGRNVRAVYPWVSVKKEGGRGEQERVWCGLHLKPWSDAPSPNPRLGGGL